MVDKHLNENDEIKSLGITLKREDLKLDPAEAQRIRDIGNWLRASKESLKHRIFGEPTRPR